MERYNKQRLLKVSSHIFVCSDQYWYLTTLQSVLWRESSLKVGAKLMQSLSNLSNQRGMSAVLWYLQFLIQTVRFACHLKSKVVEKDKWVSLALLYTIEQMGTALVKKRNVWFELKDKGIFHLKCKLSSKILLLSMINHVQKPL